MKVTDAVSLDPASGLGIRKRFGRESDKRDGKAQSPTETAYLKFRQLVNLGNQARKLPHSAGLSRLGLRLGLSRNVSKPEVAWIERRVE